MNIARIANLIIVICEIISFILVRKHRKIKEGFIYYTQISNVLALFSSAALAAIGVNLYTEVFRYLAAAMLVMTFFVTTFILVPLTKNVKGFLFEGSGLYHHTIVPILSTVSYVVWEERVPVLWVLLPMLVTLVYGLIMIYYNWIEKVEGPYPFFQIRKYGIPKTVLWMIGLLAVTAGLSALIEIGIK